MMIRFLLLQGNRLPWPSPMEWISLCMDFSGHVVNVFSQTHLIKDFWIRVAGMIFLFPLCGQTVCLEAFFP